jgi:sialate O-acetylesterase
MGQLKISPLFSDGMILQHGISVPVSGESQPESHITLSFLGNDYKAQADKSGKWLVLLESHNPGGPYSMEISTSSDKISIKDIYFGDVWLCSGQSNMELPMRRVKDDFPQEWNSPNPLIRQFSVPQEWDFSGPRQSLSGGSWKNAADSIEEFSATAWFFAKQIFKTYNHPVGLILAAWGGTPIEAFMSAGALEGYPEKIALGKQYADTAFCESLTREKQALIETWNNELAAADSGLTQGWQKPETDISTWDEIQLPGNFPIKGFCGAIWLCREFEVSESFASQEAKVWLGTIVDSDTVYINGVEVGNTAYRYPPRKYSIPAGVMRKGKNRIVIRVVCCNGDGGVTTGKPFRIFAQGSESNNVIELKGTWKYRVGVSVGCRPQEFFLHRQPMGLFNAMIAPLLGFPLRGVLWYQGESNDSNPDEYAKLFTIMINDWRAKYQNAYSSLLPTPTAQAKALAHYPAYREVFLGSRTAASLLNTAKRGALSASLLTAHCSLSSSSSSPFGASPKTTTNLIHGQ